MVSLFGGSKQLSFIWSDNGSQSVSPSEDYDPSRTFEPRNSAYRQGLPQPLALDIVNPIDEVAKWEGREQLQGSGMEGLTDLPRTSGFFFALLHS